MSEYNKIIDIEIDMDQLIIELKSSAVGVDLDDFEQTCLSLCQKFVSGIWTNLTVDDIHVKRLTSGMSNQTYYCRIRDIARDNDNNEPQDVVIRSIDGINGINGFMNQLKFEKFESCENEVDEGIVALLASRLGVGPETYGLFKTGQIMKYYPHRHFKLTDLSDKNLSEQMAANLARFHAMKPPLAKKCMIESITMSGLKRNHQNLDKKRALLKQNGYEMLLKCDLKAESERLFTKIQSTDSPIVFSHNDYRCGNTMVTEDNQVILSDFELSSYFNRGFDFSTFLSEFEKWDENGFTFKRESDINRFIGFYLKEGQKIYGKQYLDDGINTIEHILVETKIMLMVKYLLYAAFMLNNDILKCPISEKTAHYIANLQVVKYQALKELLEDS